MSQVYPHCPPRLLPAVQAASLGVPRGPLFGKLVKGEEVTATNGKAVRPADVMEPATPGEAAQHPPALVVRLVARLQMGATQTASALSTPHHPTPPPPHTLHPTPSHGPNQPDPRLRYALALAVCLVARPAIVACTSGELVALPFFPGLQARWCWSSTAPAGPSCPPSPPRRSSLSALVAPNRTKVRRPGHTSIGRVLYRRFCG